MSRKLGISSSSCLQHYNMMGKMEKKRQEVRILTLKTSLNPPPFIEVSVPSGENEGHVYLCKGYRFRPFLRFDI